MVEPLGKSAQDRGFGCQLVDISRSHCGPNWSEWLWKITLLRILSGICPPSSGSVKVFGEKVWGNMDIVSSLGWVGADMGLYEDLTVEQNLRFHAHLIFTLSPFFCNRVKILWWTQ